MGFTTYKNIANPHVTIQQNGYGQIKKFGGYHKYGQGSYRYHETYDEAKAYAKSTKLKIINCSYCPPQ